MKKKDIKKVEKAIKNFADAFKNMDFNLPNLQTPGFPTPSRVFTDIFTNFRIIFEKINEICICLNLAPIPYNIRGNNDRI